MPRYYPLLFNYCYEKIEWNKRSKSGFVFNSICSLKHDVTQNNYTNTQRNHLEILLNQPEIKMYLSFSDSLGTKRMFIWFQIYRKLVYTIWFRFYLIIFRKDFSVCVCKSIFHCLWPGIISNGFKISCHLCPGKINWRGNNALPPGIKFLFVRETGVSRHHGAQFRGPWNPQTSQWYERFKGSP